MRIAVIAANGRSGQAFVKHALAEGHIVRAGVHNVTKIPINHDNLTTVPCDASKSSDVRTLIEEQDAVVSFIGHVKDSLPDIQTQSIKTVIEVMQERGMKRIVSLTGTGVRLPGDKITFTDRLLNAAISLIDPARVKDGQDHFTCLRQSDLDWTVLRVLKLQNTPPVGYHLREHGPTKAYVSR